MNGSDSHRIPPNRVGLSLVLLLVAWLVFSFYPRNEKPAPVAAPLVAESKLHAVGLQDNPDWEGLPEFFAIWADHAQWKDGKTRFAYWNPGSRTYAYYFEATRHEGNYRFRAISTQEMAREGLQYVGEEFADAMDAAQQNDESPTHPFVFLHEAAVIRPYRPSPPQINADLTGQGTTVPVDLKPTPLRLPPVSPGKP